MPKKEKEYEYRLKPGKAGETVTGAYHKIEDGVVGTYKKIENAFVERFLEKVDDEPDKNNKN